MTNSAATYRFDTTQLNITTDDITTLPVEGVTCYTSTSLTLRSALAVRLVAKGGVSIRTESAKQAPAQVGEAVILPAGKLPARYLFAAVTNEPRSGPTLETVRASIRAVAYHADNLGLASLAIPVLRVRNQYTLDNMLFMTIAPLIELFYSHTSLQQVYVVLDEEVISSPLLARLSRMLNVLKDLGTRHATARAFRDVEHKLERWQLASPLPFHEETLRVQLVQQQQVLEGLQQSHQLLGEEWSDSLEVEIDRCTQEITRLTQALHPPSFAPNE